MYDPIGTLLTYADALIFAAGCNDALRYRANRARRYLGDAIQLCDGVDDEDQLELVRDMLTSGGTALLIGRNFYGNKFINSQAHLIFKGMGRGNTTYHAQASASGAGGGIININAEGAGWKDMAIDGNKDNQVANINCLFLDHATFLDVSDLDLYEGYRGMALDTVHDSDLWRIYAHACLTQGIFLDDSCRNHGGFWKVVACGEDTINSNIAIWSSYAVTGGASDDNKIGPIYSSGCLGMHGFHMDIYFNRNVIGPITCEDNQLFGIRLSPTQASGQNVLLSPICRNNGQTATAGWRNGIGLDGSAALTDTTIVAPNCTDTQGVPTQQYGMSVETLGEGGTVTGTRVIGGSLAGNTAGPLNDGGTDTKLVDVRGYVNRNSGASTGTGAQQTIAHGLSFTPTAQQIALTPGSATAAPYHSAAPDATNIYVTAVSGQAWYWATVG